VVAESSSQCFPFRVYLENAVPVRYPSQTLTKWDIFHYVYGLLHHPGFRARFADNLKRDLPRIPFAPDFAAFALAGRQLAELHLNYEQLEPYPLQFVETPDVPLSYVVTDKMKLSPDKTSLRVNDSLTLAGIPLEVFGYRLGNRSALEWVIDQYRVTEDARSGIRSDPNRPEDAEYIVRLVGQVVRVSVETVKLVAGLPEAYTT
jgi:predicted helicase